MVHAFIKKSPIRLPLLTDDLGITEDRGQRGFELMGHVVEERLPLLIQPLQTVTVAFNAGDLLLDLTDHFVEVSG
ncbi:hypothetical protein D3C81_1329820 [compost metagenome]